jgi:hypothetical protein
MIRHRLSSIASLAAAAATLIGLWGAQANAQLVNTTGARFLANANNLTLPAYTLQGGGNALVVGTYLDINNIISNVQFAGVAADNVVKGGDRASLFYFKNPATTGSVTFTTDAFPANNNGAYFLYEIAGVNHTTPVATGTGASITTTANNMFVINFLAANNSDGTTVVPDAATASILTKAGAADAEGATNLGGSIVSGYAEGQVTGGAGVKSVSWTGLGGGENRGQASIAIDAPPPPSGLTLIVNKTNGQARIKNTSAAPVAIDYYSIASPGSAMDAAGWTSLDDQNFDVGLPADFGRNGVVGADDLTTWRGAFGPSLVGDANGDGFSNGQDFLMWQRQLGKTPTSADGWAEAGGSSSSQLVELFLNGATVFAPGEEAPLGAAYNEAIFGANDGDLQFLVSLSHNDTFYSGAVSYVNSFVTAVPEPTSLGLGLGAFGAIASARRGRQRAR